MLRKLGWVPSPAPLAPSGVRRAVIRLWIASSWERERSVKTSQDELLAAEVTRAGPVGN